MRYEPGEVPPAIPTTRGSVGIGPARQNQAAQITPHRDSPASHPRHRRIIDPLNPSPLCPTISAVREGSPIHELSAWLNTNPIQNW